mmetsp:Transcript_70180/g.165106  ORF Transcript_70180/g.165106 Transcript_70180/m.165106 type:complete len:366 (-) Transcript_70180:8-1105(-)
MSSASSAARRSAGRLGETPMGGAERTEPGVEGDRASRACMRGGADPGSLKGMTPERADWSSERGVWGGRSISARARRSTMEPCRDSNHSVAWRETNSEPTSMESPVGIEDSREKVWSRRWPDRCAMRSDSVVGRSPTDGGVRVGGEARVGVALNGLACLLDALLSEVSGVRRAGERGGSGDADLGGGETRCGAMAGMGELGRGEAAAESMWMEKLPGLDAPDLGPRGGRAGESDWTKPLGRGVTGLAVWTSLARTPETMLLPLSVRRTTGGQMASGSGDLGGSTRFHLSPKPFSCAMARTALVLADLRRRQTMIKAERATSERAAPPATAMMSHGMLKVSDGVASVRGSVALVPETRDEVALYAV